MKREEDREPIASEPAILKLVAICDLERRVRSAPSIICSLSRLVETSEEQLDWEQALRECGRVLLPGQQLHPFPL